jgi:hypothetical protein
MPSLKASHLPTGQLIGRMPGAVLSEAEPTPKAKGREYMSAQLQTEAQAEALAYLQTLPLSRWLVTEHSRLRRQELIRRHVLRLICLGIAILSLAGLLYLTQRSAVTTTTYEIQELQLEKVRLQRERDLLRADVARLTAPERVRARAEALGFEPAHPTEFVAINMPAAPRARTAAITEQAPSPSGAAHATQGAAAPRSTQRRPSASGTLPSLAALSLQAERWLEAALAALPNISPPRQAEAWYDELK